MARPAQHVLDAPHSWRAGAGVCPICAAIGREREAFALVFDAEVAAEPELVQQFASTERLCPVHIRSLLADPRTCALLPSVVTAAMLGRCFELRLTTSRGPGRCPGCRIEAEVERTALDQLADRFDELLPLVFEPTSDLCLVHVRALLERVGPRAAGRIARAAARSMRAPGAIRRLESMLRDGDPDAVQRVRLGLVSHAWRSDLRARIRGDAEQLAFDLEEEQCPACAAGRRAERRQLRMLAGRRGRRRAPSAILGLCRSHLNDLSIVAPRRFRPTLAVLARRAAQELNLFSVEVLGPLFEGPYATIPDAGEVVGPTGEAPVFMDTMSCLACEARDHAERGALAILIAELERLPSAYHYRFRRGVCARHVPIGRRLPGDRIVEEELSRRVELAALLLRFTNFDEAHSDPSDLAGTARALIDALQLLDGRILCSCTGS